MVYSNTGKTRREIETEMAENMLSNPIYSSLCSDPSLIPSLDAFSNIVGTLGERATYPACLEVSGNFSQFVLSPGIVSALPVGTQFNSYENPGFFGNVINEISNLSDPKFNCTLDNEFVGKFPPNTIFMSNASFEGNRWTSPEAFPVGSTFALPNILPYGSCLPPGTTFMTPEVIIRNDIQFSRGITLGATWSLEAGTMIPVGVNFGPGFTLRPGCSVESGTTLPPWISYEAGYIIPRGVSLEGQPPPFISFEAGTYSGEAWYQDWVQRHDQYMYGSTTTTLHSGPPSTYPFTTTTLHSGPPPTYPFTTTTLHSGPPPTYAPPY